MQVDRSVTKISNAWPQIKNQGRRRSADGWQMADGGFELNWIQGSKALVNEYEDEDEYEYEYEEENKDEDEYVEENEDEDEVSYLELELELELE